MHCLVAGDHPARDLELVGEESGKLVPGVLDALRVVLLALSGPQIAQQRRPSLPDDREPDVERFRQFIERDVYSVVHATSIRADAKVEQIANVGFNELGVAGLPTLIAA